MKRLDLSTIKTAVRVIAAVALCACAARATSTPSPEPESGDTDELPLKCVYSDTGSHRLTIGTAPGTGSIVGVLRGTDHELIRNASVITLQPIGGGTTFRARGDSSGRFSIAKVTPGSYELRVVSIGYLTSRDTIAVTSNGMSVDVTQVIMRFLDEQAMCGYLASIDSEPVLALPRAQTTSTAHTLPTGGSVTTKLTVRPTPDGATFDIALHNSGTSSVDITRLCYPTVTGDPVRRFSGRVGPACYGTGMKLAAGDSIAVRYSVQLRGQPGTYNFRAHAVDPPVLDAVLPLTLVRGRSPRGPSGE